MSDCGTPLIPFKPTRDSRSARPGVDVPTPPGPNCDDAGILTFVAEHTVLANSTGATFDTPIVPVGAGGAAGTPGDHFVLEPYKGRMRLHAIQIDSATGADLDAISVGRFSNAGDLVGARMKGGFQNVAGPIGRTLDCDRYLKCGINPINPGCLPSFGVEDELLVGFGNNTAGDISVIVTYELEYVEK